MRSIARGFGKPCGSWNATAPSGDDLVTLEACDIRASRVFTLDTADAKRDSSSMSDLRSRAVQAQSRAFCGGNEATVRKSAAGDFSNYKGDTAMSGGRTLEEYIVHWAGGICSQGDRDTLLALANACRPSLSHRRGRAGRCAWRGPCNHGAGDAQKALDIIANDIVIESLHARQSQPWYPKSSTTQSADPGAPLSSPSTRSMAPRISTPMCRWARSSRYSRRRSMVRARCP